VLVAETSEKKPPSNLAIRLATAAVGAPAILALLYFGPAWGFFLLALAISLIGVWELLAMTHPGDRVSQIWGVLISIFAACGVYFGHHRLIITVLVVVPLAGPLFTLIRLGDISTAALRACAMSLAPLFVPLPLALLAILRRDDGPGWVVMSIMFAWFADSGGYFAGRFLGKHKLYEAVSPKKTVEGAIGGIAGAFVGAAMASLWFLKELPLTRSLPLALVACVLGQAGDLAESLIKRSTGVKDSGAIVPGHGGILDRVDALILTSATVYLYTLWSHFEFR
ncbi:MAG: phosphatidate cytidylyltransferase, partial [Polyangiaceae bacterium]